MNIVDKVKDCIYDKMVSVALKHDYSLGDMLDKYKTRIRNLTKTKTYIGRESHIYVKAWQGVKREYDL
jgi:hypothetical protein